MEFSQILIIILALLILTLVVYIWRFLGLWISALASGVSVPWSA